MFSLALLLFIISNILNGVLSQDDLTGILYRLSQVFGGSFSRLFAGFFLLLVGAVMNVYQEKMGVVFSLLIIAISVLMFAFDIPFSSLVSAVGFLSLSVCCPLTKIVQLTHLRNYSILIYLLHMFFIMLLSKGFAIASTVQIWIGAFVLSALIASVILSLSHRFRILKMLY